MAWDTDKTRRLLLEAAIEEFAEHGFAGARVNRIAGRAGVNKERLYEYFGNKSELFDLVLEHELVGVAEAVPLSPDDQGFVDLGAYAGRVFDYHQARPRLLRLLHWEGLEPSAKASRAQRRTAMYADKVATLKAAQDSEQLDDTVDAAALLYGVLALAAWRFAVPQTASAILGPSADDTAVQRAVLVELAGRIGRRS